MMCSTMSRSGKNQDGMVRAFCKRHPNLGQLPLTLDRARYDTLRQLQPGTTARGKVAQLAFPSNGAQRERRGN